MKKSAAMAPDLMTDAIRAENLQELKRYDDARIFRGN